MRDFRSVEFYAFKYEVTLLSPLCSSEYDFSLFSWRPGIAAFEGADCIVTLQGDGPKGSWVCVRGFKTRICWKSKSSRSTIAIDKVYLPPPPCGPNHIGPSWYWSLLTSLFILSDSGSLLHFRFILYNQCSHWWLPIFHHFLGLLSLVCSWMLVDEWSLFPEAVISMRNSIEPTKVGSQEIPYVDFCIFGGVLKDPQSVFRNGF